MSVTHLATSREHYLPGDVVYQTTTACQIEALPPADGDPSWTSSLHRQDVDCRDCLNGVVVGHPALTKGREAIDALVAAAASGDAVNHPNHYGGDTVYEVIKVIRAWGLGFNLGNAVKYIARAGRKDPAKTVEDLRKAVFYLEDEIKHLESEQA